MSARFRIGITRDVLGADGKPFFDDIGLELLDAHPGVEWEILPELTDAVTRAQASEYDGMLVLGPRVTADTLAGSPRLSVIARYGVGYDAIDVPACTAAGVAVTITPDGVRRPVASAMLAMVLALAHRVKERDRLVQEGRWADKTSILGTGLTGRTLGIVGYGNIGREFRALSAPLEMRTLVHDPYATPDGDVELVDLDRLLAESDFVTVCCPLTEDTRHLIGARALERMKPTAYLVNAGRGPVVDEAALVRALDAGTIAGAALDVFEVEPTPADHPLIGRDSVLLTPHAIAHSDQLIRDSGRSACRSLLDVADGRAPQHLADRAVLEVPRFAARLTAPTGVGA